MRNNLILSFAAVVIFISCTSSSFAQVPGYQGERLSINLNFDGFVALNSPTYVSNLSPSATANFPDSYINTRWMLDLDYVVSRDGSVGVSLQYLRTGSTVEQMLAYNDPYYGYVDESVNTFIDIKTTGVGAYYKFFFYRKSGSIAPIGYYGRLDGIVFLSSAEGVANGPYQYAPPGVTNYGHVATNLAVTYTLGSQSVYFNHLITNYGLEFGIIPSYIPHIASNAGFNDAETNAENLADAVRARLFLHVLTNINVGLGYLIF